MGFPRNKIKVFEAATIVFDRLGKVMVTNKHVMKREGMHFRKIVLFFST